jgi:hypothetical protein
VHNPKTLGKGLWFAKCEHLEVDCYNDSDRAICQDDRESTLGYCVFAWEEIWCHGKARNE